MPIDTERAMVESFRKPISTMHVTLQYKFSLANQSVRQFTSLFQLAHSMVKRSCLNNSYNYKKLTFNPCQYFATQYHISNLYSLILNGKFCTHHL